MRKNKKQSASPYGDESSHQLFLDLCGGAVGTLLGVIAGWILFWR